MRDHQVFRASTPLGAFGSDTRKQVYLYSGHSFVRHFNQFTVPSGSFEKTLVDRDADGRVHGHADVKSSQAYPQRFGEEVAQLFQQHRSVLREHAAELVPADFQAITIGHITASDVVGDAAWEDADLGPVVLHLLQSSSVDCED